MTIMPPADWDVLPSCSYPTSSLRDEPYRRPPPDAPRYDPYDFLAPEPPRPPLDPIFACYREPLPQEVVPGVREDGVLTARHPLVDAFIAALPHTSPRDGRKPPRETWWIKRIRGLTVRDVLELDTDLSELHSECIFVLAALRLLYHFHHPAHFTLWNREEMPRTARRVQKLLYMNPSPIASPVGWAGVHEQLWFINGLQSSLFPARNDDDGEVVNGMTLRKRKAEANAEAGVRTRKRTRSSANAHIEEADDTAHHDTSSSSIPLDKTAQQLDTTDHTLDTDTPSGSPLRVIEHTRRSTRGTSTPSAIDTPISLPQESEPAHEAPPPQRKPRARSSSSAVSCASGSTLAMSESGSGSGADTCVEPDDSAVRSEKIVGEEKEKEEVHEVRVSARVRRLAPKKAEAEAQLREEEEEKLHLNASVEGKSAKKKRARGRRA